MTLTHSKIIAGGDIGADRIFMPYLETLSYEPQVNQPVIEKGDPSEDNVSVVSIDTIGVAGYYVNLSSAAIAGQTIHGSYLTVTISNAPQSDSLVLEDGSGISNANSYAALNDGDNYHRKHLYATAWFNATNDKKEKALMMATRVIDTNFQWGGYRTNFNQGLEWPRAYVDNRSSASMILTTVSGVMIVGDYLPPNEIPTRLRDAVCELARELLKGDRTVDRPDIGVSQFSLGQGAISATFDKSDKKQALTDQVLMLLEPFGVSRARRSMARVVRA